MRRLMLWLVALAAIAYLGICALLFFQQRSYLYFPSPEVDLADVEPQRFDAGEASLKLWQRDAESPDALIYFGGNGEEVSPNLGVLGHALPGFAITVVNYRGYGGSSGTPSEAGLVADAVKIFDALQLRHARVSVIGRSLGSGVAVQLAAQRPVHRLVLVTPYDSIAAVAASRFRWLPVRWLLRDRYDSAEHMSKVAAPTLVIVAADDQVIVRARSEALIAAIPPPQRTVRVLPATEHNFLRSRPDYLEALRGFLTAAANPD